MYVAELEKVSKKLDKLFSKKALDGKDIYLFGASDNSRCIIKILKEKGYEPKGIVDNDVTKCGSYCTGLKVLRVEEVIAKSQIVWLIYSYYWVEMERQLLERGFDKSQIYILCPREQLLVEHLMNACVGKKIYVDIKKKYGDIPVFLCPYTGTGDIYLIGTFWKEYISKNKITDYVFLVISGACKKVAMLFDIKNIVVLKKQKYSVFLISYYNLCPNEMKLTILNDAWAQVNDNCSEWFRGYKGIYFTELFRHWVFDLPEKSKPHHPVLKNVDTELNKIFSDNGLIDNKTIILSPYSNTLADLPLIFWENICEGLINKGYVVCTNSSGVSEPAIKGSKPIFFPLNIAPQFVNKSGGFIGVRSGFCDVISGCTAKKIILYDDGNRFYNCSAYEYFSLKMMELSEDAIEIEYKNSKTKEIEKQVLEYFEGV